MRHQKPLTRIISVILTLAMLCGLVPTMALAAHEHEALDIIEYKAMTLVNMQGGEWISRYAYAASDNTFYENADVNLNIPSLLRIYLCKWLPQDRAKLQGASLCGQHL